MKIATLKGAPIFVSPTNLIIALLVTMSFVPAIIPSGAPISTTIIVVIGVVVGLSLSILCHELSHGMVGMLVGRTPLRYELTLFGGRTSFRVPANEAPWKAALTSASGPLANALLYGILSAIFHTRMWSFEAGTIVWALAWINLMLAIFNALPGWPLDGGQTLASIVHQVTGRRDWGLKVAAVGGLGVLAFIGWMWVLRPVVLLHQKPDVFSLFILVIVGMSIGQACWAILSGPKKQREYSSVDLRSQFETVSWADADTSLSVIDSTLQSGISVVLVKDRSGKILGFIDNQAMDSVRQAGQAMWSMPASAVSQVVPARAFSQYYRGQDAVQALSQARSCCRWLFIQPQGNQFDRGAIFVVPSGARM
ncbi:site-2 protease family protein [Actinomyces vulturis]|uniref:site-2 protease family protein n=1 Tax=Actinomyces vulturis TaxID=1857645 RepID=UPI00082E23BF|nr:site-2 protease family protein [Actinomyces vulturis]